MWVSVLGCVRILELEDTGAEVPESSACVPAEALGYRLPSARWGLSALYASRRLDDRPETALHLSPSWFLAVGWQTSGFGCADYGPPWAIDAQHAGDPGCLGLSEGTTWNELCRLYPATYPCDGYAGSFAGDAPEADALALAWFALAAHGLLGRFELDPDDWYAASADPLAVERLTAAMHLWGPWTGEIGEVVQGCPDEVEACLEGDLLRHAAGVADKLELLGAAPCYDEPLAEADVRAFTRGLAAVHPELAWDEGEQAAVDALTGRGFTTEAAAVVAALDAAVDLRLACPERELYEWYRLPCP